jgi:hypothetical protein
VDPAALPAVASWQAAATEDAMRGVTGEWTVNLDPSEPCPTVDSWARFWADPPTEITDPRLAEFRSWIAEAFAELDLGEDICEHCLTHARAVEALVQVLEDAAPGLRDSSVTEL